MFEYPAFFVVKKQAAEWGGFGFLAKANREKSGKKQEKQEKQEKIREI